MAEYGRVESLHQSHIVQGHATGMRCRGKEISTGSRHWLEHRPWRWPLAQSKNQGLTLDASQPAPVPHSRPLMSSAAASRFHRAFLQRQWGIGKCRQIRSSRMSARLPWHCGTCTRNAEAELFQAVASAPRARRSLKRIAARCSARQAVVATSAAEPLMLMIGRRTTCWRTALAAHTQSIIIFQLILSATITGGITTLRSFNGY